MKDFILVHERFWRSTLSRHSSDTRICFLAMLQLADKDGWVDETAQSIADFAALPIESTTAALQILTQPDPRSRSDDMKGRRIIEGPEGNGWVVVNYVSYREKMAALKQGEQRREYMRGYMRKRRAEEREAKLLTPVNSVSEVKHGKERKEKVKDKEVPHPPNRRSKPQTDQQARVDAVLEVLPDIKPALAAKWLKEWEQHGDAAMLAALESICGEYPDKPPNYVGQVLRTALRNNGNHQPTGKKPQSRWKGASPEKLERYRERQRRASDG